MKLERLTDLREQSFSSPDFQVGVRNDTDGGKHGGKEVLFMEKIQRMFARICNSSLSGI